MRMQNAECRNRHHKAGGVFSRAGGKIAAPTVLIVIASLLLAFAGCGAQPLPALVITGDCEGYSLTANTSLEDAIALSKPRAEDFDVFLMGNDGLVARVSGDELDGCELVFSGENAWEVKSELHPPSARVKNLAQIVVVSISEDTHEVRMIEGHNKNSLRSITTGFFMLFGDNMRTMQEEGTSQKNGRSVTVYTTRYHLPLQFYQQEAQLYAVGFDGKTKYFRNNVACYMENGKNQINLHLGGYDTTIENLAGIMAYPPELMITETYHDALRFLGQGERVMIIELDGLGWSMLNHRGLMYMLYTDAPYLQSLAPEPVLACFPPISPVGLASMLTGETPDVHGVHDRENREMACEDIFEKARAMGKACAYVEGSHALLKTSLAPVLSLHDGEVLANAQQALEDKPDLLFVHFHEIDEAAHEYGPYAEQTKQKIKEIDGYVQALCGNFNGRVIVTADHGLHQTEEGGDHGQFLPEDMIVPYIVK